MASKKTASFPYEIHELANLGEMQEKAILELEDDIRRYGYNPDFPLEVMRGKLLDGRHRQEVCVRIIAKDGFLKLMDGTQVTEPPTNHILPRGGAAAYVAQVNSLKTYRKIDTKARMIYAAENFTSEAPAEVQKRLGFNSGQYRDILKAYKKSRRSKIVPNPWDAYKAGGTAKTLFAALGIESNMGGSRYKDELDEKVEELQVAASEAEMYKEMVATREARIAELEKRIKKLDPQERLARAASGETDPEDRLRDRLEFTEEELKKAQKINEQLQGRVKEFDRIDMMVGQALAGLDLSVRKANPPKPRVDRKTRPHEFVALLSDAHYGEVVNPAEALGISYNTDVARRRIEHYRDVVVRYKDLRSSAYDIQKLSVPILGDMLSGNIHDELRFTNEKTMTEQASEMSHILFDLATDFASEFPEVEFIIIPGNHPRLDKKPTYKKKYDNWEYMMGSMVRGMVDTSPLENVKIIVPKDLLYIHEVFGYQIGMYHGDGVKSNSFAGIPFYGLKQRVDRVQSLLAERGRERLDLLVMGHFHQYVYWGDAKVLVNGAIKGGDEYSIATLHKAGEPEQVLLEFHPEHGLTSQERINLGHIN